MSFFSDEEQASLRIERTVLHVIGHDKPVTFQPLIEGDAHVGFFLARITDVASSSVHKFAEQSQTKAQIEAISREEVTFEDGARELARRFSDRHGGSSSDGAFFVIELACEVGAQFYCLIKYDYRPVVELTHQEERAYLREIVQAFVREKRAIQKCCIVRVIGGIASAEVSAVDRIGKAPDLTDYFATYLDVARHRNQSELSERLDDALRSSIKAAGKITPIQSAAASYFAAKRSLEGREVVNDESVVEAVLLAVGNPQEEVVRVALEKKTMGALRAVKLDGVSFRPHERFFAARGRRKVKTAESVIINYPSDLEGSRVFKEPRPEGGWTYRILTESDPVEDEPVRDNARG